MGKRVPSPALTSDGNAMDIKEHAQPNNIK